MTVSWGVAEIAPEMTPRDLIDQADLVLMAGKREKLAPEGTRSLPDDASARG